MPSFNLQYTILSNKMGERGVEGQNNLDTEKFWGHQIYQLVKCLLQSDHSSFIAHLLKLKWCLNYQNYTSTVTFKKKQQ